MQVSSLLRYMALHCDAYPVLLSSPEVDSWLVTLATHFASFPALLFYVQAVTEALGLVPACA